MNILYTFMRVDGPLHKSQETSRFDFWVQRPTYRLLNFYYQYDCY